MNDKPHAGVLAKYEEWQSADVAFDAALEDAGFTWDGKWWPDPYDSSCEFTDVGNDVRLTEAQQRIMFEAGFHTCYINHKDGWESYYSWKGSVFAPVKAWRKRQTNKPDGSLATLEVSEWPKSWPETMKTFDGSTPTTTITPDPIPSGLTP